MSEIMTAVMVRDLGANKVGAKQKLYKVSPPMNWYTYHECVPPMETEYVIVSAKNVMFTGPETYIFPANEKGDIVHWMELDGSYRGGMDHEKALLNAGYTVL